MSKTESLLSASHSFRGLNMEHASHDADISLIKADSPKRDTITYENKSTETQYVYLDANGKLHVSNGTDDRIINP